MDDNYKSTMLYCVKAGDLRTTHLGFVLYNRAILLNREFLSFDHKNRLQGGKWLKYLIE